MEYDKESKTIKSTEHHSFHSDIQHYDQIRIKTIPRWKESELSGDEWRISAHVEFLYKNHIIWEKSYCNCETALQMAYTQFIIDVESGKVKIPKDILCDQEGCSEQATIKAFFKKRYCVGGGNCGGEKKMFNKDYLLFCDKHSHRGDCDLEDADDNYDKIRSCLK